MASHDDTTQKTWDELPFGALEVPPGYIAPKPKAPEQRTQFAPIPVEPQAPPSVQRNSGEHKDWRPQENRRGSARRGGRRRQRGDREQPGDHAAGPANESGQALAPSDGSQHNGADPSPGSQRQEFAHDAADEQSPGAGADTALANGNAPAFEQRGNDGGRGEWGHGRRRRRRGRRGHGGDFQRAEPGAAPRSPGGAPLARDGAATDTQVAGSPATGQGEDTDLARGAPAEPREHGQRREWRDRRGQQREGQQRERFNEPRERAENQILSGMFLAEHGGFGVLRRQEAQYLPSKEDIWVPQHLVQRFKLRDGSIITGPCGRGTQHKFQLNNVDDVDGKDPREVMGLVAFKKLTSIDPDFHYQVGDVLGDVSMRILDVLCPVGRGSRGLIVAPPRSGKTILMRKFAAAIERGYPDVKLMVLLVDERPEEATEWKRSTKGEVYVSTNDENTKNHVQIAEVVWHRCQRLVELGTDVVLMLDSITRLARAYNNMEGGSGRTMSGGLDSRAMEKPRAFFGSARNTETAGSLTILGTTLIETGSRLDQLVFEEFKGTGNMEIVLSRKLADRRIFPAIDVERSGTRKEEKLISGRRLKQIHTLRRVLLKMNFVEAMELLVSKLEDVDKTDDFLKRFDVDPEA